MSRPTPTGPSARLPKGSGTNFLTILFTFLVCASLLFSSLVLAKPSALNGQREPRRGHPQAGPPAANLPNLDQLRRKRQPAPEAPAPVPSIMRGRRKPLEPRDGRKVGDPLPAGFQGSTNQPTNEKSSYLNGKDARFSEKNVEKFSLHSNANAFAVPGLKSSLSSTRFPKSKLNHSRAKGSALAALGIGDDQYVQIFFSYALLRQPNATEQAYWDDILRAAYAHGQTSMVMAAREMGKTLFESADYAARSDRQGSSHDGAYVSDLYYTYLGRSPDSGGLAYWTYMVPGIGRENVRRAFDECGEFITAVTGVTPNGIASSAVSSLLSARVAPGNQSRNQLLALDVEWSLPLINLPGRAGLDLGLGLSYSSAAVWTRSGPSDHPYLYFDEDDSSLSPGFRFGFPTVQELFFDAQVGQNAYLLITSAGSRVELRQVGTSNIYEAADSSYLQLTDNGSSLLLRSTDGTQMNYVRIENEWHCTQIKDRNGNYITVNYNNVGDITTVTDTLGRVITFNYDGNTNLASITQAWNGQTHTWATFGWGTTPFQPPFSNVSTIGAANGQSISVLTQVGLPDGTHYNFEYTNSVQVSVIRRYAQDNHQLTYTAFDYAGTDDCPRLLNSRTWAEMWNNNWGGPPQPSEEVVTSYGGASDNSWAAQSTPDGTLYKEFYATSGWQKGQATRTEVWAGSAMQKWTTTVWTQDDTSLSYPKNPRVTATDIYDLSGNHRRTSIDYGPYSSYGLPYMITEDAGEGTPFLRRTYTDYNLDAAYTSRRIIGLVSAQYEYDGNWALVAKTLYMYDQNWGGYYMQATSQPPVQHDETNYQTGFIQGRGNLVWIARFDVTDPNNWGKLTASTIGYNQTGQPIWAQDAVGHQTSLFYDDNWSDSSNHNTFAYPTQVKDADNNSSYTQYNYDFGAKTRTQSPAPAGQSQGLIRTFDYDGAARPAKVTTQNNGAYTGWWYPSSGSYIHEYASTPDGLGTTWSLDFTNGLGLTWATVSELPNSTGPYRIQVQAYDKMGRLVQQSNPAETNAYWTPIAEDSAGWVYTFQSYDWKGRPTITTNQDGTTKTASYSGCGCAGGEVVTLTDEGTIDGGVAKRRQQKIYSDVLGRTAKTEVLNWQGGSVYSSTVNTYNARDQVMQVRQYAGAEGVGAYQETTMGYDGYGRLQSKHVPEQNAGTATTYAYNNDDTLYSVTDARGASAMYSYNNNRHLVTGITYSAPSGSGIVVAAAVGYGYDAAGNRSWMTDAFGRMDYNYDQLSRLKDETRTFSVPVNGIAVGQPTFNNSFKLAYEYTISGQLKSITDSSGTTTNYHGSTVSYNYDSIGRLHDVNGSGFANVSTYAGGMTYRASGAVKSFSYGNGLTFERQYDARMRISQYTIGGRTANQQNGNAPPTVMKSDFNYYDDGRIRYSHDQVDSRFDTGDTYDWAGRLAIGYSGSEAYDFFHGTNSGTPTGSYKQTYTHDAWNNLVGRTGNYWGYGDSFGASYNNQNRNPGWHYDAAGNVDQDSARTYSIDAAGDVVDQHDDNDGEMTQIYDGDGQRIGSYQGWTCRPSYYCTRVKYYLHSSVIGGSTISEIQPDGLELHGYVYANGELIAEQEPGGYAPVEWAHHNPITGSYQITDQYQWSRPQANFDPGGVDFGSSPPQPSGAFMIDGDEKAFLAINNAFASQHQCYLNGLQVDNCSIVLSMLQSGAAGFAPWQTAMASTYQGQTTLAVWHSYQDGYQGFVPVTANYIGNGNFMPIGSGERPHLRRDTVRDTNFAALNGARTGEAELAYVDPQNSYDPRVDFRDYAVGLSNDKSKTDCLKLALLIYKAGQVWGGSDTLHNSGNIVDGLFAGLTEFSSFSLGGRTASDPQYRVGVYRADSYYADSFRDTGFIEAFAYGTNEVRHFVGFLAAGNSLGIPGGTAALATHTNRNPKAIALGNKAIDLGANFFGNYKQLAQDVWHQVCGQASNLNLP